MIDVKKVGGPIDVVVDSTGLKVDGEGEWKVRQHGIGQRRTWGKLYLAVDPATYAIVAYTLSENNELDANQVSTPLEQLPVDVEIFYGDCACDQ